MSGDWQQSTIGEECDFFNGLWKGEKPPFVKVGVIRNTNFSADGTLDESDIAVLDVEERKLEKRKLEYGDIILEKSGGGPKQPVGRVIVFEKADGVFSFSNFTSALRVRNPQMLDYRYLHKWLYWVYLSGATAAIQSNSTGIRNLDANAYKALPISIPPLSEQKRIVAILDEAVEAIEVAKRNARANLESLEQLFDASLNDAMSGSGRDWSDVGLAEICEIRSTLVDPREKQYLDLPHVGGANIASRTGELMHLKTSREEGLISGKFAIDETMTLYSKIRPYLMKVARPDFQGLCSADIYPLSPKAHVLCRDFLFYLLLSKSFTEYAELGSARAGMPKVNREHLFAYRTRIPNISMQRKIAARFDEMRSECHRLANIFDRKFDALKKLQESTLHSAFNGHL